MARIAEQEADDPITLLLFICEQGRDGRQTFSIVGTIHQVWLTDEAEAQKAVETFIARGWLRTMREEAVQAGGVETELTDEAARACPRWYVTIRFRPDSLEWFHPSIKILEHKMRAQRMWRFTVPYIWKDDFLPAVGTAMTDSPSNEREASWISEEIRLRRAIGAKAYLPRQAPIQNRLARQLAQIYGPKGYRVLCEDNHVDISIRRGAYSSFLEIKPADSAREAIRLALGQLLEYAHYPKADRADNLVVSAMLLPGLMMIGISGNCGSFRAFLCAMSTGPRMPKRSCRKSWRNVWEWWKLPARKTDSGNRTERGGQTGGGCSCPYRNYP